MAMIKVFDVTGVKELQCFDTITEVPYIEEDIDFEEIAEEDATAADDSVDF